MAEKSKESVNKKVAEKKQVKSKPRGKFTIMDLLMVIMVVGVFFTLTLSVQQTKRYEAIVRESVDDMITILNALERFKVEEGFEAHDISQLNLRNLKSQSFTYAMSDTAIVATSTTLVAVEKEFYYDLRDRRFRVNPESRDIIEVGWLP